MVSLVYLLAYSLPLLCFLAYEPWAWSFDVLWNMKNVTFVTVEDKQQLKQYYYSVIHSCNREKGPTSTLQR